MESVQEAGVYKLKGHKRDTCGKRTECEIQSHAKLVLWEQYNYQQETELHYGRTATTVGLNENFHPVFYAVQIS